MRSDRVRGQGSAEFVGLVAVAVLLVGSASYAVAQSNTSISAAISTGICEVTSLGQGDCGDVPTSTGDPTGSSTIPTYRDPALTPVQKATKGSYVALGDSYSSGEGGSEYEDGTDVDNESQEQSYFEHEGQTPPPRYPGLWPTTDPYSNLCHRSTNAYGQQVAEDYGFDDRYDFKACSGAVINDFTTPRDEQNPDKPWSGNDGEDAQEDYVDADTSLITFSIGGNDAKFADTLQGCIEAGLNPFDSCSDEDERDSTDKLIDDVGPRLTDLLLEMRKKAPNARILVVGYPRFFSNHPDRFFDGTQIDKGDQKWINGETRHMDDVMKQAVEDAGGFGAGFEFVDVYDAFDGCEIGKDNSCMHNLDNGFSDGKLVSNGSYHPNDRGHDRLAALVEEQIKKGH